MSNVSPCKDCPNRHPACHGECDQYKEWVVKYHAEQQYLKDNRNRFGHPWSPALEKRYRNAGEFESYIRKQGGSQ